MKFDWNPEKNKANIEKHGIDFEDAKSVFETSQPYLDKEDDGKNYGEERRIRLGWMDEFLVVVVYTIREDTIRLISARLATSAEEQLLVAEVEGEKKLQKSKWERDNAAKRKEEIKRERIRSRREREEQ